MEIEPSVNSEKTELSADSTHTKKKERTLQEIYRFDFDFSSQSIRNLLERYFIDTKQVFHFEDPEDNTRNFFEDYDFNGANKEVTGVNGTKSCSTVYEDFRKIDINTVADELSNECKGWIKKQMQIIPVKSMYSDCITLQITLYGGVKLKEGETIEMLNDTHKKILCDTCKKYRFKATSIPYKTTENGVTVDKIRCPHCYIDIQYGNEDE
jgi:hypothetical protein